MMEGVVQWASMPPSLRPAPTKREPLPFYWGSSQAFADRLAGALTSQVFKETKTIGRAVGKGGEGGASGEEE